MTKTYKKIDDETVEITTTIPEQVTKEKRDRAELQTELDHIPDRRTEAQDHLDSVAEQEDELKKTLKVFE